MLEQTSAISQETERVRGRWDKRSGGYDRRIAFWERVLFGEGREWACSQATGQVLEIAVGTGRNLALYPADVELTAIELSPSMLEIAKRRAEEVGRPVDLQVGDAQALEFPDESFDTVVCTLGLCTIPDDRAATSEAKRVLRSGGRLILLEHVRSPVVPVRLVQRLIEPVTVRLEGDHVLRDPLDYLEAVGFECQHVQRLKWGIVERVVARKPGRGGRGP
jgi:ubiquinone/menaquinone biosynthesis C-methylase UbiE